ncbi:hypothetical protein GY21_07845 [Cryobacterium roopkundense]|uniref:Uncharacterized protein n=1 Tax=Cryobacterium roopkundense TaxID=1001240 RepID=A0A099JGD2_9MICO|nr:hypothetical protein [Cryobacterium roopkundense]KGJ77524.1 hypothetical protein GY21_07845 [Cryobacterium roopkundense]MBB5642590.1 hypothetical protein [Cryobacterium roopkundense]
MNTITKRIAVFGATGAAASALIIGGLVAPAQADSLDRTSTTTSTVTDSSSDQEHTDLFNGATGNGVLGNDVANGGVANGGLVNGGVGNGSLNPEVGDVASGTELGNGNAVASGNDISVDAPVTAPITAPVEAPVEAPVGNGTTTDVDGVDTGNIDSDVNNLVDDVLGDIDLNSIFGR